MTTKEHIAVAWRRDLEDSKAAAAAQGSVTGALKWWRNGWINHRNPLGAPRNPLGNHKNPLGNHRKPYKNHRKPLKLMKNS